MRLLSSPHSRIGKYLMPGLMLLMGVTFVSVSYIASGAEAAAGVFLFFTVIIIISYFQQFRHEINFADEVYDAGDHLIIRKGKIELTIPLHDIKFLSYGIYRRVRGLDIHLRTNTSLGSIISFYPDMPFIGSFTPTIYFDLIDRIDGAKTKNPSN